jgi:CRISPR-associated protein Cmr4
MSDESKSEIRNQKSKLLFLFTRTPLHVGAGASVGAIDQPIVRERHTGFPVIPASSLKGTFSDEWNERNGDGKLKRNADGKWLFGETESENAFAGALQFSEARVIAFPIRSAKGSFAWITCPLMLQRAARDGVVTTALIDKLPEPKDEEAIFDTGPGSKLALSDQVVLEEYTFKTTNNWAGLADLGKPLVAHLAGDPVWGEVKDRLVILSNGMMSYFARNACEIAQHVRISDETGTAEGGALFNQENVPSETLFYSVLHALDERSISNLKEGRRLASEAIKEFQKKTDGKVFQFGGDASTGLGYCTVKLGAGEKEETK